MSDSRNNGPNFIRNVLWNWLGTIVSLAIGFVLSPYLILKLGADGYGVWAITFALVEYYWFFDLGFRSATVKFVAHYAALDDSENVRAVLSTVLLYSSLACAAILASVAVLARYVHKFFQIPVHLRAGFETLLLLMTLSWCLGLIFNAFNGALEAVQRFEYSNKAAIVAAIVRAIGWGAALYLGYGLVALGVVTVVSQIAGYAVNYVYFRSVFGALRLSPRFAHWSTLREMAGFGIHTFVMTVSTQLRNQGAPVLIGHFLPAAFVGFYNLPVRLLQYSVELVGRIGIVTNTKAAELAARERSEHLKNLAIYANRYCLVIFMPFAILLATHGSQLLSLWVGPSFAAQCAPLLLPLLLGCVIGVVGQYSAGMLLQGVGKHRGYSRSLLVEAIAGLALLVVVIPRWGILGAAWVSAALTIVNRGVVGSWLVSRTLGLSFAGYVRSVYWRPLAAMLPVLALSAWLRPGIIADVVLVAVAYYPLAFFVVLDSSHREMIAAWIVARWRRPAGEAVAHV
jgi:O-antigen/teichoic acid export membrane protein